MSNGALITACMTGRPDAPATLGAFLLNRRSPETRRAYGADLAAFSKFLGVPSKAPHEVARALIAANAVAVIAWRDAMVEKGAAPATVSRRLAALRTFYSFAKACRATTDNPASMVEHQPVEACRQRAPYLEAAHARRLLDAPDTSTLMGLRDRAILGLLACSGLRRAEVVGLHHGDLRCEAAGVSLQVLGKGGRTRTVDVDRATADALLAYLGRDGRAEYAAEPSAPLFRPTRNPRHNGDCSRALTLNAINALVGRCARRAEVDAGGDPVAPHTLRRTFATVALDRGASLEVLRRTMGHADVRTTARYDKRRETTLTVTY